jgi:hypothetical protein
MVDLEKIRIAATLSLIVRERVSPFVDILTTLAAEVSRLTDERRQMTSTDEAGDVDGPDDAWLDLESVLDDTLGLAMVCCQTMFERTISAAKKHTGRNWKLELLGLGELVGESQVTQAALTCALANYYKHEREWDKENLRRMVDENKTPKKGENKLQFETARVLMTGGLDIESPAVLGDGVAKLVGRTDNLLEFAKIFDQWRQDVHRRIMDHLIRS